MGEGEEMESTNEIWLHDTSISVTVPFLVGYDCFVAGKEGDWKTYNAVRGLLRECGWTFHQDPEIKKRYRSLARTHHAGSRGGLHFTSEINPRGFKFEFYEDVVRDNPHGGRYHFDKLRKMPYLRRLSFLWIRNNILALLGRLGFTIRQGNEGLSAMDRILKDRRESWHWKPGINHADGQPDYNVLDAGKVRLQDGDVRCFWSPNGRLRRGKAYYNLNSMWWVITADGDLHNESAWELFTYDPDRHGRKLSRDPLVRISAALRHAVEQQHYERAAAIRDAIARFPGQEPHEFKPGDRVLVDNPRYNGPGIVDQVRPPFWVVVKVGQKGDGNAWRYEWATVKPDPSPAFPSSGAQPNSKVS